MRRRHPARRNALALLAGLTLFAGGESALGARTVVDTDRELRAAVEKFKRTGGVIVLRPGRYGRIYIGPRAARRLTLRARGASTPFLHIRRSRDVRVRGLTVESVAPPGGRVRVLWSTGVILERVDIRGAARLTGSTDVAIRQSLFSDCPPRAPCIYLGRASGVYILKSTFADCTECDFIRGGVGADLLIRDNLFGNALAGECRFDPTRVDCNHQDQIQLVGGENVVVARNRFGIYEHGAAQLYLSGPLRNVVVRNNVFRGIDPVRPGYVAPVGITVGNSIEPVSPPLGVLIAHNTILSGSPHRRGTNASIALSPLYADMPVDDRPTVVNNVLGSVQTPEWVCDRAAAMINNIVREGSVCSDTDLLADPLVDELWGVPMPGSPAIGRGATGWALDDLNGIRRDASPDVGAYELIGT